MKSMICRRGLLGCAALAFTLAAFAPLAVAAEADTIIVKEKEIITDTVVGDKIPSAQDGTMPAVAPFKGHRERVPAGAAVVGIDEKNGQLMPDVVNYATSIVKQGRDELVLNTTISKLEDDVTLNRLAAKVYRENGGQGYNNVTIFWFYGDNPEPGQPWGRTDVVKGDMEYKVIRIER